MAKNGRFYPIFASRLASDLANYRVSGDRCVSEQAKYGILGDRKAENKQITVFWVIVLPTIVSYAPKVLFSSQTIFFRLPLNSVYCLSAASAGGKSPYDTIQSVAQTVEAGL